MAAAEEGQVKVKDRLARSAAAVQHRAVAFEELAFSRKLGGDQLQFAKDGLILGCRVGQRFEMFAWTNQDVRGRLRADVLKGEKIRIFVDNLGWNLLRCDFAEQTVGAHRIPPAGVPSSSRVTDGLKPSRSRSWSLNWCALSSPEIFPTRTRYNRRSGESYC